MSVLNQQESQSVVNQLRSRLAEIKDSIKQSGLTTTVFNELTTNAKQIQNKLDEILRRGGVVTEEDKNEAFEILERQRKEELQKMFKKNNIRAAVIILGSILVLGGLFYYVKKRK